jgi:hypothetical protein
VSTNTSLKNYQPTRQVCKPDLLRIARALGLNASEKERTRALVNRCIEAAQLLRRDLELASRRRP